jgi:hypothetical protein
MWDKSAPSADTQTPVVCSDPSASISPAAPMRTRTIRMTALYNETDTVLVSAANPLVPTRQALGTLAVEFAPQATVQRRGPSLLDTYATPVPKEGARRLTHTPLRVGE